MLSRVSAEAVHVVASSSPHHTVAPASMADTQPISTQPLHTQPLQLPISGSYVLPTCCLCCRSATLRAPPRRGAPGASLRWKARCGASCISGRRRCLPRQTT